MTIRVVTGIAALACVPIFGLVSGFAQMEMVDKVNDKLNPEDRFELAWWYFTKTRRLHREYRNQYPDGRLLDRLYVSRALVFVCVAYSGWGFGIL